jgi:hypothetical protein
MMALCCSIDGFIECRFVCVSLSMRLHTSICGHTWFRWWRLFFCFILVRRAVSGPDRLVFAGLFFFFSGRLFACRGFLLGFL